MFSEGRASHVANTHKVKILTLKTTKCWKNNEAQTPMQVSADIQQKTHQQSNHVITATSVNSQLAVAY